jgi:hypothetical protein
MVRAGRKIEHAATEAKQMPHQKASHPQADKPMVHTAGEVFSDGSVLELIQGPNCELNLLRRDGQSAERAGQFVRFPGARHQRPNLVLCIRTQSARETSKDPCRLTRETSFAIRRLGDDLRKVAAPKGVVLRPKIRAHLLTPRARPRATN